jgi:hypothetical protein
MKISKDGIGYAWVMQDDNGEWEICNWAEPCKDMIMKSKPSPEAKVVKVRMILFSKRKAGE